MKRISLLAIVLTLSIFAKAQVTGVKNIPGDYATLAAAIADLNATGVGAGGTTINLNQTETAPAGGYLLGSATLNASTGITKPIVINGGNNVITAQTGSTGTVSDAVLRIAGPDYVTINQLNIVENSANTTAATQIERAVAIMAFSATDGSQNVTIQNCSINLNGTKQDHAAEVGIFVTNILYNNTTSTYSTAVLPTSPAGKFDSIIIKGNTINNCYNGIAAHGGTVAATAANLLQTKVIIGGTSVADANSITNHGSTVLATTTAGYGIYVNAVTNVYVSYNNLTATNIFNAQNHVHVTSSAGDIVASNNTVAFTTGTASTGAQTGINMTIFSATLTNTARCDSNIVQNVTLGGTNVFIGVNQSVLGINGNNLLCRNNLVDNIGRTGLSGNITGILFSSSSTIATTRQMTNNKVSNITATAMTGAYTFNGLQWSGSSGLMKGNTVENITITSTFATLCTSNIINNSCTVVGVAPHLVDSNIVNVIAITGPVTSVFGAINTHTAATSNVFARNVISNVVANSATSLVEGIFVTSNTGTSLTIQNNSIYRLMSLSANADNSIKGINVASGDTTKNLIYNNTIYLSNDTTALTSSGANFGLSGICFNVGVTIKNNIVNVKATPSGTGRVSAIRSLLAGTLGTISANFGANSSNNILHAPKAANSFLYSESAIGIAPVVFYNLINDSLFNSSCSIFKVAAGLRGTGTYTGNNLSVVSPGIYAPVGVSLAEGNAVPLASVTTDILGTTRPSTPDCGAVEFAGTTSDFSGPTILYTNTSNSTFCTSLPVLTATITDASGVNTTAGTKPRVYYKKSTEADALVGNTNADNGWKFVEASNSSSPFTFILDHTLLTSAIAVNDVIQYFVVAQDNATTPNIGSQLVSYATGYCPTSVNLLAAGFPTLVSPTINNYTILAPNVTLSTTAIPSTICTGSNSTLSVVDTTTIQGTMPTGYAGPFVTGIDDQDIARVQIVGTSLNNSSSCTVTGGGASNGLPASILKRYSNYTSTVAPVTLTSGTTYTVNLDGTVCGAGSGFQMGLSAFIDLNRNGVFDMPAERVYGNPSLENVAISPAVTTKTFTFTIPTTGVVNGPTLMRFYMNGYAAGNTHTPTTTTNFGEIEDYQIYLNTSFAPLVNSLPNTAFTWSPTLNLTTNPNKTVVVSNVTTNTDYTVTATDGGGCTYTKSVTVTLAPAVQATGVTGTITYCASTPTTTLTATTLDGVAPFTTSWTGAPVVSVSGLSAVLNPSVGDTTYTVTVTDFCGTSSTTTVKVTVIANPTAVITPGNSNVCFGAPHSQTAIGSPTSTYTWMPGSLSGANQTMAANSTTTYTVTIVDGICSSTTTFTHTIKALPTILSNTAIPSTLQCAGDSIQLDVTALSGINDYEIASIPYAPTMPTVTPVVLCDAGVAVTSQTITGLDNGTWSNLPIGFTFEYFGNNYTTFQLSTNGFISVGPTALATAGCCVGQTMPNNSAPNNVIALAWGDLDLTTSGKIDYFVEGVAPNRKLVIRYTNVPRVGGLSLPITGQIELNETSNFVELQVASVNTAASDLTTMGIENVAGNIATIVSGRNSTAPWIATNEGWRMQKSPIFSYNWANNTFINNATIQNPKVAPNFTTTYTITVSNSFGCTKTSTATANIRNLVSGVLNPTSDTICVGESSTILGSVPVVCTGTASNFQGYYAPSNWSLTQSNANPNGFVSIANVPASIVLVSGSNNNANGDEGYLNYSKTIECGGTVSFNWAYSTPDLAFADIPFYSINGGTPIIFPGYNVNGSSTQTGNFSLAVNAGDILTLSAYTLDNDLAPCSITITNFVAPAAPISGTISFWNSVTGGTNLGNTSITVNPISTTTYYAQYTDAAFGCVNPYRDSIEVFVNSLPVITTSATPNDTVCIGKPVTLQASGAVSYTWNGVSTLSSDSTLTPAVAGTYTVVGTDANGCVNTTTQNIYLNSLPIITASVTSPICLGNSTLFVGGGAGVTGSYVWDNGVSDNTPFIPLASGSIDYTVTGTDANGCSATSSVALMVDTLPTVLANVSATPICFGASTILTGSGASTYTWSDGTNTPMDNVAYTPLTAGTTTYTVTGTDGNTCSATSSINVFVHTQTLFNSLVTLIAKCPGVIGASMVVSSPASNTFAIAPTGPAQPSSGIFTSMIGGTTYTVTLTDANMCTNTTAVSATNVANGGLSNATASNILSVPGNSCQNQNQTDGTTLSYYGATCDNLIATVNDGNGGNTLGNVNTCVTVMPTVPTFNGQPYLPRYFIITPQNQGPADITLYFTQDDFDDYNAAAGAYPQIPAVQTTGTATFCISQVPQGFLPGASGATTIVHTVTATWNATAMRWEVTFPVTSFSGFYCHACNPLNSALPAAITDFKGQKTTSTDILTWTTTSELNNASFNVLYSNNGKEYSTLGVVNSKAINGYSNQKLTYSFENTKPTLGHNYYKLEQVDIDGKSMINTNVVDLIWGTNGSTVSIYPNPTTDELNIDLFTSKTQNTSIKVLDMSGRVVKEIQTKSQIGANNIKLNLGELASGVYSIQIFENSQLTQVSKIEKK